MKTIILKKNHLAVALKHICAGANKSNKSHEYLLKETRDRNVVETFICEGTLRQVDCQDYKPATDYCQKS